MPLSEEELRLLEQMEQALAQEDPKFASALRGSTLERTARLRTIAAGAGFVVGVATLLGGAMSQLIWLGVIGFLVMLGSATAGLAAWRSRHAPSGHPQRTSEDALFDFDDQPRRFEVIDGGRKSRTGRLRRPGARSAGRSGNRAPRQGTFMQRMEQRWERRRQQGY